jgi:hypothetical protein
MLQMMGTDNVIVDAIVNIFMGHRLSPWVAEPNRGGYMLKLALDKICSVCTPVVISS